MKVPANIQGGYNSDASVGSNHRISQYSEKHGYASDQQKRRSTHDSKHATIDTNKNRSFITNAQRNILGESPPQDYSTKAPNAKLVQKYNPGGNSSYERMQAELDKVEVTNSREVYYKENR